MATKKRPAGRADTQHTAEAIGEGSLPVGSVISVLAANAAHPERRISNPSQRFELINDTGIRLRFSVVLRQGVHDTFVITLAPADG